MDPTSATSLRTANARVVAAWRRFNELAAEHRRITAELADFDFHADPRRYVDLAFHRSEIDSECRRLVEVMLPAARQSWGRRPPASEPPQP
ncbi:MAG: hypothetical protein ACRDYB_02505 [Acidimicrobiales bacterium]